MTNQELKELFEQLERAGMNPQLCDTPVPYFENYVKAGVPANPGDATQGEYILLPKSLVGMHPTFVIDVDGDSMRDIGIMDGDRVHVQMDMPVSDGDIVMACVNGGECTVKAYCEDEQGRKWLVPRNAKYKPILLTEDMNVRIIGKVVGQIKDAPRASYRECLKTIRQSLEEDKAVVSRQRAVEVIRAMGQHVTFGRLWYAVYRAVVEQKAVSGYDDFVALVAQVVPEHAHLPVAAELQRMAVQSFSKPVPLWNRSNAPVKGRWFDKYQQVGLMAVEMLAPLNTI